MAKVKLSVTVTPEISKWMDQEIKNGFFADKSHAVQYSLTKVKELINKGEIKY